MYKNKFQLLLIIFINILFSVPAISGVDSVTPPPVVKKITLTAIYFNQVDLVERIEIFALYEKYLGARIEVVTLNKICTDITNYYRHKGFDFAHCILPPQEIKDGVVKMRIVEGVIGAVSLVGDIDKDDGLLTSYIEHITLNKPLDRSQLYYVEQLINAVPGISVESYTRAIPDSQQLELVFDVNKISFNGEVYANNRGSRVLGPAQLAVSLTSFSMLDMHEYLRLYYLTTGDSEELKYVEINTFWPVGNEGSNLFIESSYANASPGDFLESADIDIDIATASIGWSKPVIISETDTLLLTGAIDYFESDTDLSGNLIAQDELYKVRLSLDYITNVTRHYTKTNLTFKQGIKNLNTSEIAVTDPAQNFVSTGREEFSAVSFDFYYRVMLNRNLFLSNQVQGQYAFRDLPVSEDIVFGGDIIGSAYDQAELFGDHGLGGKTRLSYQLENSWITMGYTQFYTQYDIARVWNETLDVRSSAASLATGITIGSNAFYLDLQAAQPLTKQVLLEGNKDTRFFANARLFF